MNELEKFLQAPQNQEMIRAIAEKVGQISKADTIDQSLGLLWYDLRPVVQLLYPYKQLIPLISRLPRVPADGGNAFHWKRITAININNVSVGVSEGNRGAGISINLQDQQASYKTLGLESAVSFEARLGAMNLTPDALGTAIQSTLRSTMIGEEQTLIGGNASTALGTTPTPTLTAAGTGSSLTAQAYYVVCVALSHQGWLSASIANGVPGQITKTNTDGSTDTFGGGSGQPSAQATITPSAGEIITATVTPVANAVAYAWYFGETTAATRLQAITTTNQVKLSAAPSSTNQLITALEVSGAYQDNSTNALVPDGILSQIYGSVFGSAPSRAMATSQTLPSSQLSFTAGGSLVFTGATANTGLTISGMDVAEFDFVLQAAYDQYKIGYDRILISSADVAGNLAQFLGSDASTSQFRVLFDAEATTGRIVAGRRVTSYLNKFYGNTLDIEIHPYLPQGTILFWSDRAPYELSGVPNILEAHVRMDYYQIQWPFRSRRYEYGVYCDEVFACYFTPAFAVISNLNPPTGTPTV